MAVTVTDRRTPQTEADSITGWTGAAAADTTQYAEATASVAAQFNISTDQLYNTGTSRNLGTSPGTLVYVYTWNSAFRLGVATGAHTLMLGDGTNRVGFHMSGNDREAFSHSDGPVVWQNFVLDTSQAGALNTLGANYRTVYAGTYASLNFGAITQFGAGFITQSKALGGGYNCFVDIVRFGNDGIRVTAGGSGTQGKFLEIVAEDRSTTSLKAHGVIRELTTNTYGIQSPITFGDSGAATTCYFSDNNVSLTYENRYIGNDKYYFTVEGNAGATNSFVLTNSSIVSAGPFVTVTMSNANINTLTLDNVTFAQLGNAITFASTGTSGHNVTNCTFRACGQITVGTVTFTGNTIRLSTATTGAVVAGNTNMSSMVMSGYEGTANTSALIYNVAADPSGKLDDSSFTKGTAATHAIEFGLTSPTTMTLNGIAFSGYNASNAQNDSTFHFKRTTGTVTLNLVGCTGNISYRTDGATIVINQNVTVNITVQDIATTKIQNAQVAVYNASTDAVISNELTDVNGLSSFSMSASTAFYARIRKSTAASTRYFPIETVGNSGTTGTSLTITLTVDNIASA